MNMRRRIRVGAVSYLNTRPLVRGLEQQNRLLELVFDLPSRLADRLATGQLDVALIPSIEFFQDPTYTIVSDACIACRGPVWSVKLLSRVPPRLERLPIGAGLEDTQADAVLLIGDRAMHIPPGPYVAEWDLGAEWTQWTGCSFVFAMWVARPGVDTTELEPALSTARDTGLASLEAIAAESVVEVGLPAAACRSYLRDNLYFYLGADELQGLRLFRERAAACGLAPGGPIQGPRRVAVAPP